MKVFLDKFDISAAYLGEISAGVTIIIAIVLYKCIISPVDKRRYALSATIAGKTFCLNGTTKAKSR